MATVDRYVLEIETAGAERNIRNVGGAMGGLSGAAGRLKGVLGPLAAGLAAVGAVNIVGNKINEMDDLAKAARAAGAAGSEEAFQGFQAMKFALAEAGVEAATADRAFLNISQRMLEGSQGGKAFGDIFDRLKDGVTGANGELKSSPEILQTLINAMNDGTISADEFQKVVGGRAGPVISQAFAGINDTAEKLNATLVEAAGNADIVGIEAAENAEVFNDNIGRLKESMGKLLTEAVTPLLPILVELSEKVLANLPAFIEGVQTAFQNLEPVFQIIGTILNDLVIPALQLIFSVLGKVAEAIAPLVEAAIPALKLGFETLGNIVESIIGFFERAIETLGAIGTKARELKETVTGAFGSMKDSVVNKGSEMYNGVTGWFDDMYDYVVGNSVVPDMVEGVLGSFDFMNSGLVNTMKDIFSNVTSYFTDIFNNVKTRTAQIRDSLSNIGGGISSSVGNAFGGVSDFFAGFFANGGFIPGGKFGVVGERGAELVSGPANVTPLDGLGGVTYNINAVDVNSFQNLLARDPGYLHALVQKGQASIPGGRR
ncbi:hypothetical protein N9991_00240 [bacterium]|nr:hypothetical protein [bacterium]